MRYENYPSEDFGVEIKSAGGQVIYAYHDINDKGLLDNFNLKTDDWTNTKKHTFIKLYTVYRFLKM